MKQEEIENRLGILQKEILDLQPETEEVDEATHEEKITILKYYLEQSVKPNDGEDIPEDVIRAFILKIVAHKDSFDWYLRFSPDKTPKSLDIEGKRRNSAKVSPFGLPQHRLL